MRVVLWQAHRDNDVISDTCGVVGESVMRGSALAKKDNKGHFMICDLSRNSITSDAYNIS